MKKKMKPHKKITDTERLDWLLDSASPLYSQRNGIVGYWAGINRRFWGRERWTYRQAIDADIKAANSKK